MGVVKFERDAVIQMRMNGVDRWGLDCSCLICAGGVVCHCYFDTGRGLGAERGITPQMWLSRAECSICGAYLRRLWGIRIGDTYE